MDIRRLEALRRELGLLVRRSANCITDAGTSKLTIRAVKTGWMEDWRNAGWPSGAAIRRLPVIQSSTHPGRSRVNCVVAP